MTGSCSCHGGGELVRGRKETSWKGASDGSLAGGVKWKRIHLPLRQVRRAAREERKRRLGPRGKRKGPATLRVSVDFPKRKYSRGKKVLEGVWRKRKTHKNMCWAQGNILDFTKLV